MELRKHLQSDCPAAQGRPERAASRPEGCLPIQREPGWGLGKSPFERELRRGLVRGMMGRETLGG